MPVVQCILGPPPSKRIAEIMGFNSVYALQKQQRTK